MQTLLQEMFRTSIPTPAIQNRDIPFCSAKREKWVTNRYKLWMKDAGCCAGAWDTPQRSRRNVRRFQSIVVFYQLLAQKLSRKRKIGRLKKKKSAIKSLCISTNLGSVVVDKDLYCGAFIWWYNWVYLWASTDLLSLILGTLITMTKGNLVKGFSFFTYKSVVGKCQLHVMSSHSYVYVTSGCMRSLKTYYSRCFPLGCIMLCPPLQRQNLASIPLPWWWVSLAQQPNSHPGCSLTLLTSARWLQKIMNKEQESSWAEIRQGDCLPITIMNKTDSPWGKWT